MIHQLSLTALYYHTRQLYSNCIYNGLCIVDPRDSGERGRLTGSDIIFVHFHFFSLNHCLSLHKTKCLFFFFLGGGGTSLDFSPTGKMSLRGLKRVVLIVVNASQQRSKWTIRRGTGTCTFSPRRWCSPQACAWRCSNWPPRNGRRRTGTVSAVIVAPRPNKTANATATAV